MELTKNAIIVTYANSGLVAFVINYKYGQITLEKLREYCIAYFSRIYEVVKVEFVGQDNFTKIHLHTTENIIILDWNWNHIFS
jgi:hypothetical protein